jgi:hypothetical protein
VKRHSGGRFDIRFLGRALAVAGTALAVSVCGEQGSFGGTTGPGGGGSDAGVPGVVIDTPAVASFPVAVGDSVYLRVHVTDDRGVTRLVLTGTSLRGSKVLGTDTTVDRFISKTVTLPRSLDTVITRYLLAVPTDSSAEIVTLTAVAQDSLGNDSSGTATIRIVSGPRVSIVRPSSGAATSVGKSLIIEVRAIDPNGVRIVGWRASGVVTAQDSVIRPAASGALPDTATFMDTLAVPVGTVVGNFTIVPFGTDSLGDPSGTTPGVTVSVQSAASDNTRPTARFSVGLRVEVSDSITVTASDAGGIKFIGWRFYQLPDTVTIVRADTSPNLGGTLSDVTRTFPLNLPGTLRFPSQVSIRAFAIDQGNNSATTAAETLTVVAGKTFRLPPGSQIGDAIYNANRRELYLSNTSLNRIDVFSVAADNIVASIPVGSRPLGLAMWPRDTLGNYRDTLIVANSGGANLSLVDLVGRREFRRHRVPNYVIQKIKTKTDPNSGNITLEITEYDYSDRPQYVGAVCRQGATTACDSVIAVYSTTPTTGQTGFPERGYLAWENLMPGARSGHFFWEPALATKNTTTDTLQVISVRDSVPGTLVRDTLLGGGVGLIVDFDQLQFQDTTFVRNSGNFLRVLIGEGGIDQGYARVLTYDPRAGFVTHIGNPVTCTILGYPLNCTGVEDRGVSSAVFVRDFIANRASRVQSIAMNWNGLTMLVRADSIYAFDRTLRQTGIIEAGSGAVGMDLHPNNAFDATIRGTGGLGGTGSPSNRLVFAARPDSSIDVFDTYFYGQVRDTTVLGATIPVPIRNSLIGPVRVATDAGGTMLFGLTTQGLVSVRLPSITNSLYPVAPQAIVNRRSAGGNPRARSTSPPNE